MPGLLYGVLCVACLAIGWAFGTYLPAGGVPDWGALVMGGFLLLFAFKTRNDSGGLAIPPAALFTVGAAVGVFG